MRVSIIQPSFLPWRGYFHQCYLADLFVFLDCVQYDRRGWRNRNRIKTNNGTEWITIPANSKGCQTQHKLVKDIKIAEEKKWKQRHLAQIHNNYKDAEYYQENKQLVENIYEKDFQYIADLACYSTELISRHLGIKHTKFIRSSSLRASGRKTERLLSILKSVGGTNYLSGPSAINYLDLDLLSNEGIHVDFMDYKYREYPQLGNEFETHVSILDLLMNTGPAAWSYIWGG